jgi:hypothetical protein
MGTAKHENVAIFQREMSGKGSNERKLLPFLRPKSFREPCLIEKSLLE